MFQDNRDIEPSVPTSVRKRKPRLVFIEWLRCGRKSRTSSFLILLLFLFVLSLLLSTNSSAQHTDDAGVNLLIPMGGGYKDLYSGFLQAVLTSSSNQKVNILVLPIAYASNSDHIPTPERNQLLDSAQKRRNEIYKACQNAAPPSVQCTAKLLPILTHADAMDSGNLIDFTSDLSAVFILDGDPKVAMEVIDNSPLEQSLEKAYLNGVIIAGTGGGAVLQSKTMIAGYGKNFSAGNAIKSGASLIWNYADEHGLPFGIPNAVIEQRIFQEGNVGRLLTTLAQPGSPKLGIGMDAYTGMLLEGEEKITKVFGLYEIAIFDAITYHSIDNDLPLWHQDTLSLRNIVVHLLAPGSDGYDLLTRTNSLAVPLERIDRDFNGISLPSGSGVLYLSGDTPQPDGEAQILNSFISLLGRSKIRILFLVVRHESNIPLKQVTDFYRQKFDGSALVIDYTDASRSIQPPHPKDYDAIVLMADDQELLAQSIDQLTFIRGAWLSGKPLLAFGAAISAIGPFFSAEIPTPQDPSEKEIATQASFLVGQTKITPGLDMIKAMIEPQLMSDNRWGRFFSLAYSHPENLAIGLTENTALIMDQAVARTSGSQAIFILDLRGATLGIGENQGFEIANGLLDTFAGGEIIRPKNAEINLSPQTPIPLVSEPVNSTVPPALSTPPSEKKDNTGLNELAVPSQQDVYPYPTYPSPYYPFGQTSTSPNLPIILGSVLIVIIVVLGWVIVSRRYRY